MQKKKLRNRVVAMAMAVVLGMSSMVTFGETGKEAKAAVTGTLQRVSVHDPSIIKDKGQYYIFGSHITAAKSADLSNWTSYDNGYAVQGNKIFGNLTTNLAEPFKWAGDHDTDCQNGYAVWAPDVKYNPEYVNSNKTKGAYMMYFCVSSTYCRSAIAYAVSDKIDGTYTYKGTLLYSGFTKNSAKDNNSKVDKQWENTNIDELISQGKLSSGVNEEWFSGSTGYNTSYAPNAIDPTIFTDTSGKMWMTYGSWSGGIFILEINPKTGEAIYPKTNGKTTDGRVIDKYFGTHLAGGKTLSGEGPYILYDEESEYYYLYTTYNYLDAVSGYNMRLFRSKNPTGPYEDAAGRSAVFSSQSTNQYNIGIKVMGNYNIAGGEQGYRSPGHNSAFVDEDGQRYLIYHTRFQSNEFAFATRVHQQFMNEKGWPVTAVYENRGDKISESGYPTSDIVGTYHFINHGTASDGSNVNSGSKIALKSDGTISGNVSGTWKEKEGSYYATLTIGGVEYNGVFFKQHNEKGDSDEVMTFTAIGSNNMTIWGAKISDNTTQSGPEGKAGTDFSKIKAQPVLKCTFENQAGIKKLYGDAVVEDGVLKCKADGVSQGKTYAELQGIESYDFSKGITITADIVVSQYTSDWTPIFMLADTEVGSNSKTYPYHFTQGFSSIADLASGQVGYYGVDVASPYSWDYFSNFANRDKWHTVAVTITNSGMSTYINGVKVQSEQKDFSSLMEVFTKTKHVYLGGSVFADPDFSGWMDNVAIYNRALNESAIKALATGQTFSGEEYDGQSSENAVNNEADKKTSGTTGTSASMPVVGTKMKDSKTGNTYKVKKTGKTVTFISAKNKKIKSVNIAGTVTLKGVSYKVVEIAPNACAKCKKLKKVTIGKNIAKIGKKAFYNCASLKKITIQTKKLKMTSVGTKAFSGIHLKATVKVPKAKKKLYKKMLKKKGLNKKRQTVK